MKNEYHIIGLMSGTSLDGVDLAYCTFQSKGLAFKINHAKTFSYSADWKRRLESADQISAQELALLDIDISKLFVTYIKSFISEYKIRDVDAISSHGHTIFHQPENGFTCQVGRSSYISALSGYVCIGDFRTADVALGGQGAPLVPIGDRDLFSSYINRINLGGFANISFEKDKKTIAFDICPLNMALNQLAKESDLDYDPEGSIARSGKIIDTLLEQLNELEFYRVSGPKSLAKEWYLSQFLPVISESNASNADKLRTLSEHMAMQIARSMRDGNALISGGGSHNSFLIERIKDLSKNEIHVAEPIIIDFKEALIFAYLGYLRLIHKINVLSSVSGASKDHIAGNIHLP